MSAAVLAAGVAPFGHIAGLTGILAILAIVTWRYHVRRREWTAWRLNETHALVERIAGHRTRMAQEIPEHWHVDEDRGLEEYIDRSSTLDRLPPVLTVVLPRTWTMLALMVLAPAVMAGTSAAALAVSIGGLLLAAQALRRFADGLSQISGAVIAWRQARPLFDAAAHRPSFSQISETTGGTAGAEGSPLLDVRNVSFRYLSRPEPVLHSCTVQVRAGDRVLLQGPSGGGKSTFASLVAGLRNPDSGLILLGGLDRRSLGEHGWRRRAVSAPQFHENHVFAETFAFNLLMGRQWPPTADDVGAAKEIVAELGLTRLVAEMPAGLLQLVGEGGWQLSHGERSRLFMARALLQRGEVLILDESFAALDPENLRSTLECVLRRAPTLLVVAHP
jgi:ATP-binding cassette subfamily B protein